MQFETVMEHFEAMLAYYGEHAGVRIARKHLGWYSAGLNEGGGVSQGG